jgi:hypothetical protein
LDGGTARGQTIPDLRSLVCKKRNIQKIVKRDEHEQSETAAEKMGRTGIAFHKSMQKTE